MAQHFHHVLEVVIVLPLVLLVAVTKLSMDDEKKTIMQNKYTGWITL